MTYFNLDLSDNNSHNHNVNQTLYCVVQSESLETTSDKVCQNDKSCMLFIICITIFTYY